MKDFTMVRTSRLWRGGQLVGENLDPDVLRAAHADEDCLVWLDVVNPTTEALHEIGRAFDLGETALEDAVGLHERPKVTRHDSHLFFTTSATWLDTGTGVDSRGLLRTSRISGFVMPHALVTVRLDDDIDMTAISRRWDENAHLVGAGPRALVHGLLDVVVDGYFTTIQTLDDVLEELEDELFEESSRTHEVTRKVFGVRKDLVALRRVVLPMREVVSGLMRHREVAPGAEAPAQTRTDLDSWFDDLYDHVLRASEWTESLRDMVTSIFETNLSLQDSRLNQIMKQLAAWGAIIAVPTAITGWFGQNVPYPGFSTTFGFWQSVTAVVALPVVLWFVFRRQGWL